MNAGREPRFVDRRAGGRRAEDRGVRNSLPVYGRGGGADGSQEPFWVTVEAASRYYTLTEISSAAPDFDSVTDASSMAAGARWCAVAKRHAGALRACSAVCDPVPAGQGRIWTPASEAILNELAAMLNDHPTWRLYEGHDGRRGMGNTLSLRRARRGDVAGGQRGEANAPGSAGHRRRAAAVGR